MRNFLLFLIAPRKFEHFYVIKKISSAVRMPKHARNENKSIIISYFYWRGSIKHLQACVYIKVGIFYFYRLNSIANGENPLGYCVYFTKFTVIVENLSKIIEFPF